MSAPDIRHHPPLQEDRQTQAIEVNRVACTGHGICASVLPEQIDLDEWGYPVLRAADVDPGLGGVAIRLCPARALLWSQRRSEPAGGGRSLRREG